MTRAAMRGEGCLACTWEQAHDHVYQDDLWSVRAWKLFADVMGMLVVVPRRHTARITDLTEAEAVSLSRVVWLVSRELSEITDGANVYLMAAGDGENVAHFHLTLKSATDDIGPEHRGGAFFEHWRAYKGYREAAERIRGELSSRLG
jgi:diadenosine tetraphosphate (Ap4A) HIT family hydrolase